MTQEVIIDVRNASYEERYALIEPFVYTFLDPELALSHISRRAAAARICTERGKLLGWDTEIDYYHIFYPNIPIITYEEAFSE